MSLVLALFLALAPQNPGPAITAVASSAPPAVIFATPVILGAAPLVLSNQNLVVP